MNKQQIAKDKEHQGDRPQATAGSEPITVVKIGGALCDDENALAQFIDSFCRIDGPKALVHGGGKMAEKVSESLGISVAYTQGRRVTSADDLRVVTMVYAGWINKSLTAHLVARQKTALGICGPDVNLITAHKRVSKDVDYGYAGDIDDINATFLLNTLQQGIIPVIAPITCSEKGQLLNTNADTVAARIAAGLKQAAAQVKLLLCLDTDGVLKSVEQPSDRFVTITHAQVQSAKANGHVSGGMLPKLQACQYASEQGVDPVYLCHHARLHTPETGTLYTSG